MAVFMVETKSTRASIEVLAKPLRANKYTLRILHILSEVFLRL